MTNSVSFVRKKARRWALRPRLALCITAIGLVSARCEAAPNVLDSGTAISVNNGLTAFSVNKSNGRMTSLVLGRQQLIGGGSTLGYFSTKVYDIGQSGPYVVALQSDNPTEFQFSKCCDRYWTRVDTDGSFDLTGVRPGRHRLSAYSACTVGGYVPTGVLRVLREART